MKIGLIFGEENQTTGSYHVHVVDEDGERLKHIHATIHYVIEPRFNKMHYFNSHAGKLVESLIYIVNSPNSIPELRSMAEASVKSLTRTYGLVNSNSTKK